MSPTISHRRLCALSTPELFILCSFRLIAQAIRDGREVDSICREGFEIARLSVTHAHRLAASIRAIEAAVRPLEVRNAKCAEVGEDEELLLQVLLLLQHENEFGARRVLWRLLPPAVARVVLANLDEVAVAMVRVGLLLPPFPYVLRPCPAEALATRRLCETTLTRESAEAFWLN